ncbi:MAG: winged helix-turn-helix transcriptional regulator [Muribaculaceae bacterium]|nr:winged helix-turn-helix transcriptional regulator [Muribaculaceae bacterium]
MSENPRMTRIQLTQHIGISENGVKKIIAKMKEAGWIEREGSNKNGYWKVIIEC